jgi:ribosomal protein S12
MPTLNQITKNIRVKKYIRNKVLALEGDPQKKVRYLKLFLKSPKKPSSGKSCYSYFIYW